MSFHHHHYQRVQSACDELEDILYGVKRTETMDTELVSMILDLSVPVRSIGGQLVR